MVTGELEVLSRAHALFAGVAAMTGPGVAARVAGPLAAGGAMADGYAERAGAWQARMDSARQVDTGLTAVLARAHREHDEARQSTGAVLQAARADAGTAPDNPIAARELLRRRIRRLRAQHGHVLLARRRARRRRAALRALRYRVLDSSRRDRGGRRGMAVRAALSRLGRPYVWGATGPDRFDCSGLVQWAYRQAGVPLHRTTYEQIHDGVAVARSHVRAGDLVFPHAGHVQLAIGGGLVVEAPHAGATVQISRMGETVVIRRPL